MMTKDDIKKALKMCADFKYCDDCPYFNRENKRCRTKLQCDALILITEQEKEIERLKAENKKVYAVRNDLLKENDELIKTNAELLLLPKQAVKQAKIDVLNELREKIVERMGDREYMGVKYKQGVFSESEIDEMIAEVQNAEDKS